MTNLTPASADVHPLEPRRVEDPASTPVHHRQAWSWTIPLGAAMLGVLSHVLTWSDSPAGLAAWQALWDQTDNANAGLLTAIVQQSAAQRLLSVVLALLAVLGALLARRLWKDADIDRHLRALLVGLIALWLVAPLVWQVQWHRLEPVTIESVASSPMNQQIQRMSLLVKVDRALVADGDLFHALRRSADIVLKAWLVIGVGLVVAVVLVRNP
ncbi:hypothetical protein [Roseateles amylovorans]|uniref:DUF1772 domain-containing protein n=1 Tax=Roseateles amylovorans TaxID=2978473 RepID=A0ABY6B4P7_9BURK|nr:hypothetical protein [Roseateles amylovorans]UXH79817.1 hypothetical protein N4261_07995 [Roseateles amylovorans]